MISYCMAPSPKQSPSILSPAQSTPLFPQGLTPLSIGRSRLAASALGALWGFGHSTGQLILGFFFVLLKAS